MPRPLRIFSSPRPTTSEISQLTFQCTYLLRPGPRLNALVGALARAQELYPAQIHAFVVLSEHLHLLATFEDAEQMAGFMGCFTTRLSKEVGLVHDWKGSTVFPKRYHHVELSEEPEIELARLRYVLSNGCKEGLVLSPLDWPGASSTEALVTGRPMRGVWIDRTAYRSARNRGEEVTEADFEVTKELRLEPLPSLAHLSSEDYRKVVIGLVREVEEETVAMHKRNETVPLGIAGVLAKDPHYKSGRVPNSPRPWFHVLSKELRQAMYTALTLITVAYREASERFRAGEYDVEFPEGTFPPARPFVRPSLPGLLEPG